MRKNEVIQHIHGIIGRLVTAETEDKKNQLSLELKNALTYPPAVLSCLYIDETHILKKEALIIVDAFESVTNGMDNSSVIQELASVGNESPFYPWVLAIYAIQALYDSDTLQMKRYASMIDTDSPPALFTPFFSSIEAEESVRNPILQKLFNNLWNTDSFIESAIHQLKDSLENELEDIFIDTGILFIKHISGTYPDTAKRLGLWLLRNGSESGFDISAFVTQLQSLFGQQEGFRLIGLGLKETEPEIALFFFLKSLMHVIHDSSKSREYVIEFLRICSDILGEVDSISEELNLDVQFWKSIENIIASISDELLRLRDITISFNIKSDRVSWLKMEKASQIKPAVSEPPAIRSQRTQNSIKNAVQLELF